MLSFRSYVWKCIIGGEIAYGLCLSAGYLPWRNESALNLHHMLFETLPGFVWGSVVSAFLGALYVLLASFVIGMYFVWMHNSSIKKA